jgi:hypothetical protein
MARSSPARITRVGRRKGRQRPQELVRLRAVATHRGIDPCVRSRAPWRVPLLGPPRARLHQRARSEPAARARPVRRRCLVLTSFRADDTGADGLICPSNCPSHGQLRSARVALTRRDSGDGRVDPPTRCRPWELRVYAGIDPDAGRRRYRTATVRGNRAGAERGLARPDRRPARWRL